MFNLAIRLVQYNLLHFSVKWTFILTLVWTPHTSKNIPP
jgi:hypothetical protein